MSGNGPDQGTSYLKHLVLKNYRCFQQIETSFEPDLTVFTAPNGGGKTALLDGAAIALRYFVDTLMGKAASKGFDRTDMRLLYVPIVGMVEQFPTTLEAQGAFDGIETFWSRSLATREGRTDRAGAKELKSRAERLRQGLQDYSNGQRDTPPELPVLGYYGTGRLWDELRVSRGKRHEALSFDLPIAAYEDCLSPSSNFRFFALWFERVVREAEKERSSGVASRHRPQALLETVRRATDVVLEPTGWQRLDWDFVSDTIVAEHPSQGQLPVSQLSDGIRNTIALVADLAHHAARVNAQFGGEASLRSPGIVLIDEVDMHLHPEWQQTILGSLGRAFPRMQFLVTTHSPQVLSTIENRCIRVLSEDGTVTTPEMQTRGVESTIVLAEVMGVDPIPQVEEARWVRDYKALIDTGQVDSEAAVALRARIDGHFGPLHPVVTDCDRLIRWQQYRLRREPKGQE